MRLITTMHVQKGEYSRFTGLNFCSAVHCLRNPVLVLDVTMSREMKGKRVIILFMNFSTSNIEKWINGLG